MARCGLFLRCGESGQFVAGSQRIGKGGRSTTPFFRMKQP